MMSGRPIGGSRCEQLGCDGSNSNTYAREPSPKNYRELADVKLPKEKKRKEGRSLECCVSGLVILDSARTLMSAEIQMSGVV